MSNITTFFAISHDLFCIIRSDGYIKKVNPAFINLLGYTEKELLAKSFLSYIHPDDVEATENEYAAVSQGKINSVIENRFRKKDGGYCWLSWSSIVPDNKGLIYSASQDITEKKRLQEQLRQEQEDRQKEITAAVIRAQEKERARISWELHDNVNQVLTTVKLYIELCLRGTENTNDLLQKSAGYLKTSIEEIRNLSRQLSMQNTGYLNIKDSVGELVNAVMATAKVSVSVDTKALENLDLSEELHLSVYRILQELLTSVLKHSKANNVAVRFTKDRRRLTLTVADDGKGFDPKQKAEGSGIKNITARTQSQRGTLELITVPGSGCTYVISFPLP